MKKITNIKARDELADFLRQEFDCEVSTGNFNQYIY